MIQLVSHLGHFPLQIHIVNWLGRRPIVSKTINKFLWIKIWLMPIVKNFLFFVLYSCVSQWPFSCTELLLACCSRSDQILLFTSLSIFYTVFIFKYAFRKIFSRIFPNMKEKSCIMYKLWSNFKHYKKMQEISENALPAIIFHW